MVNPLPSPNPALNPATAPNIAPPDERNFKRDIVLGDTGDDVAAVQKLLIALGMQISEDEQKKKQYGESTLAAAEVFAEKAQNNPLLGLFFKFIAQYVLHIDPQEFGHPERAVGERQIIRNYQSASGMELTAREAGIAAKMPDSDGTDRVVALANSLVGLRQSDDVVRHFCDGQNVAWCAGFSKHMFDAAMPGVYSGTNLGAISFKQEAAAHGAFRERGSDYTPHVGDAVVFSRTGGNHVGIVTRVEGGKVTYVSGNYANAVSEVTYDNNHPPATLLGYSDSHALAHAKGLDKVVAASADHQPAQTQTPVRVAASR